MVKNIVQIVRDADYEAQYRTLPVSQKPAIGKSLFGDLSNIEGAEKFQTSFNSERFIHRDVHEIMNRRSGDHLGTATVQARTKQSTLDNDNVRDFSLETVSSRLGNERSARQVLQNLPKQLRAVVIARVLSDNNSGLNQFSSSNNNNNSSKYLSLGKDRLKTKLALRRQLLALERALVQTPGAYSKMFWDAVNDFGYNCSGCNCHSTGTHCASSNVFSASNKGIISDFNSSSVTSRSLSSLSKSTGFAFCEILNDRAGSKNLSRNTVDLSGQVSKTAGARLLFSLRKESGFGTAPIWYQQSMENGPPFSGILAGIRKKTISPRALAVI
jgi:hypothetical protein